MKSLIIASLVILSGCVSIDADEMNIMNLKCDAGNMKYCTAFYNKLVEQNSRTDTEARSEFLVRCYAVSVRHGQDISQCADESDRIYKR